VYFTETAESNCYLTPLTYERRTLWPRRLRRVSAAARFLGFWVRIPPGAWMSVSEFCLLSDRGMCVGLITRPEESCWVWCVSEYDRETSIMGGSGPLEGCCTIEKGTYERNSKPSTSDHILSWHISCLIIILKVKCPDIYWQFNLCVRIPCVPVCSKHCRFYAF